ncbi:hypothetical protein GCM10007856_17180 [Azospirillum oryzae]|nr:hypothetical protein GCM10007856_17180 [Azospirillum oryzae]
MPGGLDPAFDYSDTNNDFWFDYAADTGDGWDSTFAIASLLGASVIDLDGRRLPRGRFLILGGDEVYPTPSRDSYRERLVRPFAAALPDVKDSEEQEERPHLYAIPGNHDWYDGLSSFLGLFCRRRPSGNWGGSRDGRRIGLWQTQQNRSYFVLKLPGKWWVWAFDIQLNSYVDQPQIDYFQHVATHWMEAGSRVVLCTAQPDWIYAHCDRGKFSNLAYVEYIIEHHGHELALVLSGDMHNYNHYLGHIVERTSHAERTRHYITAGGGGAFLHPTHHLPHGISFVEPGSKNRRTRRFDLIGSFPDPKTSRRLTWRNLAFAATNAGFTAAVASVYAALIWILDATSRVTANTGLVESLGGTALTEGVSRTVSFLAESPLGIVLVLTMAAAYTAFVDVERASDPSLSDPGERIAGKQQWPWRVLYGGAHFAGQFVLAVAALVLISQGLAVLFGVKAGSPLASLLVILLGGGAGGLSAATTMGIYLIAMLNGLHLHWNEAFSALRCPDYKNLLRLRIARDGTLSVYALGVERVPRSSGRPEDGPISPSVTLIDTVTIEGR